MATTTRLTTRRRGAAALTAALLATALAAPAGARPPQGPAPAAPGSAVTYWDLAATDAATAAAFPPPDGHVLMAYVSIAVYDAAMAVHETHEPFAVDEDAPAGTSPEAAVAAAARAVLLHHLPADPPAAHALVEARYEAFLATVPDGPAEDDGVALGARVAAALIALRQGDGYRVSVPYTAPVPPVAGVWIPTATTPPLGTFLAGMTPFALRSADQLRPVGPPALTSHAYAVEVAEVQAVGGAVSATRTAEQEAAARFWGEPPVPQARAAFRGVVAQRGLDLFEAARFLAVMSVSVADAFIACGDAKYHFATWRPVTAIRAAGTDGNPETVADPTWGPLLGGTPNHPEYPSAHSCVSTGAGTVIARFFRTSDIDYTVPSVAGRPARHYSTPRELTEDINEARIWGGVHFRSAVEDGATIASRAAHWVLAHHFK